MNTTPRGYRLLNTYSYVYGNPLAFSDPHGLGTWDKFYGLPKDFWKWLHRQDGGDLIKELKDPLTGQVPKDTAREWYEIWKNEKGSVDVGLLFQFFLPFLWTPSELAPGTLDSTPTGRVGVVIPGDLKIVDKCGP